MRGLSGYLLILLIQFDGKTNTLGEWETRKEWEYGGVGGGGEEMESCIELREGMSHGGGEVVEDKRKSGRKKSA